MTSEVVPDTAASEVEELAHAMLSAGVHAVEVRIRLDQRLGWFADPGAEVRRSPPYTGGELHPARGDDPGEQAVIARAGAVAGRIAREQLELQAWYTRGRLAFERKAVSEVSGEVRAEVLLSVAGPIDVATTGVQNACLDMQEPCW